MAFTDADKNRVLWLSGILHAFTHAYQIALIPLYILMRDGLRLSGVEEATLLVTVMATAYYLPSYPMGVLADRHSRRFLLAVGLAVNGLGFVGLAWAPTYPWALAAVLLAGLGGSVYHPAATAWAARMFPVNTGRALGLVAVGASVGFFITPIYVGWRAATTGSWRAPVLELGLAGMVFAPVCYWLAPADHAPPRTARPASLGAGGGSLFPTGALWAFFLAAAFCFALRDFGGSGVASLSSLFLQNAHGFSPKATGVIVGAIFLASALSNPLFGRWSDRGRIGCATGLLLAAVTMLAVFPFVPKGAMFLVLMTYGFFLLATYPVVEAAVMEAVPDAVRGRVFGVFGTLGGLLGNLAHWVVGALVRQLGPAPHEPRPYHYMFWGLGLCILCSLIGLPFLHAIRRREAVPPARPQPIAV